MATEIGREKLHLKLDLKLMAVPTTFLGLILPSTYISSSTFYPQLTISGKRTPKC